MNRRDRGGRSAAMAIASLGYRTDLMLLELAGSEVTDRGEYVVVRTPSNPTFWWGSFLLFRTPFAPGDVAHRLDAFRREHPQAAHVALGIDTTDGVLGADDEVAAAGLEVERNTVMSTTEVVPPARPNTDATIRPLATHDDWDQQLALSLAVSEYADTPGHEEFARGRNDASRRLAEAGHGTWFGAFDGDRLRASLGIVSSGRDVARYQNVQTHPGARNRGLAGTLVHHAASHALTERGATTLVMVADPQESAIRIYRRLGFSDDEIQVQLTKRP